MEKYNNYLEYLSEELLFTVIDYLSINDIFNLKNILYTKYKGETNFWEELFKFHYGSIYNLTNQVTKIDTLLGNLLESMWKLFYINLYNMKVSHYLNLEDANFFLNQIIYTAYYTFDWNTYKPKFKFSDILEDLLYEYDKLIVETIYTIVLFNINPKFIKIKINLTNKKMSSLSVLHWLYKTYNQNNSKVLDILSDKLIGERTGTYLFHLIENDEIGSMDSLILTLLYYNDPKWKITKVDIRDINAVDPDLIGFQYQDVVTELEKIYEKL